MTERGISTGPTDATPWADQALWFSLLAMMYFLPMSITIAQGILYFLCFPLWVSGLILRRDFGFVRSPFFVPVIGFILIAVASSVFGLRPEISLRKCDRLVMLLTVFMWGAVYRSARLRNGLNLHAAVVVFLVGSMWLGMADTFRAVRALAAGEKMYDTGMTAAQMHMVASLWLLTALACGRWSRWPWFWVVALLSCALGMVAQLKRAVWATFILAQLGLGVLTKRYKVVLAVVACAVAFLFVPRVQSRLGELRKEMTETRGGRLVLWTKVAPAIIGAHPWGIGYRAATHQDFKQYVKILERNLDHLHNNYLQITLELGWIGSTFWLGWMGLTFVQLWRAYQWSRQIRPDHVWIALGALVAFAALMVEGLVDTNFGDSESLIIFGWLMGLANIFWQWRRA
jgi:O-antigen ligase